jgi:hypothetical protein
MRTLAVALLLLVAACKDFPGADGRYAHQYPGHSGEGGTGLPPTPYDPYAR